MGVHAPKPALVLMLQALAPSEGALRVCAQGGSGLTHIMRRGNVLCMLRCDLGAPGSCPALLHGACSRVEGSTAFRRAWCWVAGMLSRGARR